MQSKQTCPPKSAIMPTLTLPQSSSSHIPARTPTPPFTHQTSPSHTPNDRPTHILTSIQQQIDQLVLSTNMKFKSLANTFTQRFAKLFSLYQPPTTVPQSTHYRTTSGFVPHSSPLPFHTTITLLEFGFFLGPYIRLDTPKFDGQDPAGWLYRINEYFDFYATPANERIHLVSLCIEGQASEWFRWMRSNDLLHSWDDFLSQVRVRSDLNHFKDYIGALSKLCQTFSVLVYQAEFERQLNKVTDIFDLL